MAVPKYIVSRGRWESRLTSKALERMGVPYRIVIEEQEYDNYASVIDESKLLVVDKTYQDNYDTCDILGTTKSKGPGPVRNFVWDHAINEGYALHWVMDDNIKSFKQFNKNKQLEVLSEEIFINMEEFVARYTNVLMAGPNYDFFVPNKHRKFSPFVCNTRIYSCNLIRNDAPYRWRGRYNEDTILSLDMLKDGWCTIQFNAFLQVKMKTQVLKGGNTTEFYAKEGTWSKSRMQVQVHPDVSRMVWRYGRWHHHVDYRPFKKNKLIRI